MNNEDLKFANLKENPFRVTPQDRVVVWAGRHDLQKVLEGIVTVVRNDKVGTSEFVVLHGELGTGKSHALRYLKTFIEERARNEFRSKCVYLETLRVSDKITFLDIYSAILNRIGMGEIQQFAKRLVERVEAEANNLTQKLPEREAKQALARRDDMQKKLKSQAIENILDRFSHSYLLWEKLAEGDADAWFFLSASKQKIGKNFLTSVGATTEIVSDFEAINHLAMIVNLTCGPAVLDGESYWKAFYLFVDEVETMADLEPKTQVALNQAFRDFLNACPEHLCMMFGLTGEAAEVEVRFANALLDRMTRSPIEIPTLDSEQSLTFLKEVLKFARPGRDDTDPWHPFEKEALEYIIENTTTKTPRNLFIGARKVLLLAAGEGILRKEKKITRDDAERLFV